MIYETVSRVSLQYRTLGPILKSRIHFVHLQHGRDEEVDALLEQQQSLGLQQSYDQGWRLLIAHTSSEDTLSDMIVCFVVHEHFKEWFCEGLAFHRSFLAALSLTNEVNPSNQQPKHHSHLSSIQSLSKMSKSHTGALTSQARLKTLTFGAEETTRLLDVSSSSKTSLTGIIQAALVASLFANLPSEITILHAEGRMSPQEFQSFGGTIAESNNMPGFAHREIHTRQEITTASVWCEAQHIHSGTKAELARKKSKVKMDSARGRKSHNKADIRDSAGEAEDINLLVSNMGDFRDHKQSDSQEQLCCCWGRWSSGSGILLV